MILWPKKYWNSYISMILVIQNGQVNENLAANSDASQFLKKKILPG